jgi:superfamily II DNA/RNA helicase
MTFDDLGLSDAVRGAVQQAGYTTPTPIQAQAIPHILERRDVLGIAQTGTGKTAAFTLPMLTMLETGRARARMPRTLILEPTRELAAQVEESFSKYGVNHKLSVALLIGGVSFGDQDVKITRGADVLIATPGRLLDHVERGKLLLTGVELLVIDEADRMLDMGFIPDIERICKLVPFTRQTLFFTATMPPEIQRLTGQFLHNPIRVEVAPPATTAATIHQTLVATGAQAFEKRETLRALLAAPDLKNAIIFCNRKRSVVELHRSLLRYEFSAAALHGDMDQPSRMRALEGFRQGETKFLVASDVAARGLDIPAVSHIFNFDTPHHAEDYVHRIGRTGRAGLPGTAITLVTPDDTKLVAAIEKLIGQSIAWASASPSPVTASGANHQARSRGGRTERGRPRGGRRAVPALASGSQGAKPADPARERKVVNGGPRAVSKSAPTGPKLRRVAPPEREPAVLGLGDHVPNFLMRPTPRR